MVVQLDILKTIEVGEFHNLENIPQESFRDMHPLHGGGIESGHSAGLDGIVWEGYSEEVTFK